MYLHFNYKGNAKVDETAKAASQFIPDLLQLKCSGYVQNKQKNSRTNWQKNRETLNTRRALLKIQETPNDLQSYSRLNRETFAAGARTGHLDTEEYLNGFDIVDQLHCMCCESKKKKYAKTHSSQMLCI